jgi:hypothetical protein
MYIHAYTMSLAISNTKKRLQGYSESRIGIKAHEFLFQPDTQAKYAEKTYYFWTVFASFSFVLTGSFLYHHDIGHSDDKHVRGIFMAQLITHAAQFVAAAILHFYPVNKTYEDCMKNYRMSILGMFIVNFLIGIFDIVSIIICSDDSRVKNALLTYMTAMTIAIPMMGHISMKRLLINKAEEKYNNMCADPNVGFPGA